MIIFLYGPDTFRSQQYLKSLKEKFIREVDKSGLNLETIEGKVEIQEIKKQLSTLPFLAKKRMIILENIIAKNKIKQFQKGLIDLLKEHGETPVIIVFRESEVDKNSLLFKKLLLEKYVNRFDFLAGWHLKEWYKTRVGDLGAKIQSDALYLIVSLVGNDLWQANSELKKLTAYVRGRQITAKDVQLFVKNRLEENIFMLTDALGQRNKKMALKLISDQLSLGTKPSELFSKMVWQFRNLLRLKSLMKESSSLSSYQIATRLGLHPFVAKKTLGQIGNFEFLELKKIYQSLLEMDYKIKTSQARPELLFNLLVAKN